MKTLLAVLVITGSSIALASPAVADDPPPVPIAPGQHTMSTASGKVFPVTVALDCGPACFSFGDTSTHLFRWAGDKWLEDDGMWTVDGITFTNRNGRTATVS